MCVQSGEEEAEIVGTFGAAAAVQDKEVISLQQKCVELALIPRTVFGAYKNARARRDHALAKQQKNSAEKLFVRIEKVVKHSDSCFLSEKRLSQLTSMCLQLVDNTKQQQQQQQPQQQ